MSSTAWDIYCRIGQGMMLLRSVQWDSTVCQQCCIGSWEGVKAFASRDFRQGQEFLCTPFMKRMPNAGGGCLAHFRDILSCTEGHDHDLSITDWTSIREELRAAMVDWRDGSSAGLRQGPLLRMHRLILDSELFAYLWRNVGRLRVLYARHLVTGRPTCLIGHLTLQLFLLLFADGRLGGFWKWEGGRAGTGARPSIHAKTGSLELFATHESADIPEELNKKDVLTQRLLLLQQVRWSQLMDSGWPIFKVVGELTLRACVHERRRCAPDCSVEVLVHLLAMLEDRLTASRERIKRDQEGELLRLAQDMSEGSDPRVVAAREVCGKFSILITGAFGIMSEARAHHFREAMLYLAMVQLHLQDLSARSASVFFDVVQTPQLWELLGFAEDALQSKLPFPLHKPCGLNFCPGTQSPNITSCKCEVLYPIPGKQEVKLPDPSAVCMISADLGSDRPLGRNLSRLVATDPRELGDFWTLTHHLNRLYSLLQGYRFRRPELDDASLHALLDDGQTPARRVQWSIVRLVQRELEDRSCAYVVWLDSDAFIASSQPLEDILVAHGLLQSGEISDVETARRDFLFASATAGRNLNISDHFMVIRNTAFARRLLQDWWELPLRDQQLARFREELFLEQTVMNELFPQYTNLVAVAPLRHFEGYGGIFVRHGGGIKEGVFAIALRDALVARVRAPQTYPNSRWAAALREDAVATDLLLAHRAAALLPQRQATAKRVGSGAKEAVEKTKRQLNT